MTGASSPEFGDHPEGTPEVRSGVSDEASDLAGRLLQLAAFPANAEVVDAALRLVVALAHATVTGADGVSVMLSRAGSLATVAASDETISGMDADQYATGQGPCVSAATDGKRIHVDSLDTEARWPEFIPRARERGINSILSMPLLTRGRPLGALNIYSNQAGAFRDPEQSLAALCAQQASDLLASASMDVSAEDLSARLRAALQVREAITLAVGIVMKSEGISADDAHALLLQSSHHSAIPLRRASPCRHRLNPARQPPRPRKGPGPEWAPNWVTSSTGLAATPPCRSSNSGCGTSSSAAWTAPSKSRGTSSVPSNPPPTSMTSWPTPSTNASPN